MFVRKFANWIQFANGTKSPRTGQNIRDRAAFADGTEHILGTWQLPEVLSPINTIAWRHRLLRPQKRLYKAVYRGLRMSKKGKPSRPSSASPLPPPPPPGGVIAIKCPATKLGTKKILMMNASSPSAFFLLRLHHYTGLSSLRIPSVPDMHAAQCKVGGRSSVGAKGDVG